MTNSTNKMKTMLFPIQLQFFADGGEGGDPAPEPVNNGGEGGQGGGEKPEHQTKTFTQEELDKIVADRLARERKKYEKYADYDEMKAKLAEYEKEREERERAEMTELERFKTDLEKVTGEKSALEQELVRLREQMKQDKIRHEFTKAASSAGITHVDDAYVLAQSDLARVTFDDDGNVVGIDEVVKALVENKPFLVGKKEPESIGGPNNPPANGKTAEKTLEELAEKARKSGRPEDRVAYLKAKAQLGR